ncbi:hypothetical protein GCM10028827_21720 [Mucilaginibacter myungsuensis]|uniref:hypothetical protein n=1 Tax=Mucilaginibacter myungsuensis TaxID=649104 RepID=UPI0025B556C0|nr:hypothetical protein [Mucilaginibacter myungsuensis]MDN3600998.1 hypothetical protein [Mucilaginibacter myungsuensis]
MAVSALSAESDFKESVVAAESDFKESVVAAESAFKESVVSEEPEPEQAATVKVTNKAKKPNLNAFFMLKSFLMCYSLLLNTGNPKR